MTTHAETRYGDIMSIHIEEIWNYLGELLINIWKHSKVLFPFVCGCINIVACTISNLPVVCDPLNSSISWTVIWEYYYNSFLFGISSDMRLPYEPLMVACQPR
jgi:hypothetical protein